MLLRRLGGNLEERGGKLQRSARATRLLLEDEQCVGVVAKVEGKETEHRTNADGGFQSSPEHLAKFITPVPSKLFQRNAESGTGDGLRMAAAAGADLRGMDRFYGHLLSIDAPHRERLWPYPYLDALVVAGILIGPDGKRFCDEGWAGFTPSTVSHSCPNHYRLQLYSTIKYGKMQANKVLFPPILICQTKAARCISPTHLKHSPRR